jgi:predicted  nucleic acid-binding Zn-ribbon protein
MNEVKQLWALQRVDLEMAEQSVALQQIESKLGNRGELDNLRASLLEEQQKSLALKQEQRDLELEGQGLADKLVSLDVQLYAGGKGSKELTAIQQDMEMVKGNRKTIEDKSLDLMVRIEAALVAIQAQTQALEEKEKDWVAQQEALKTQQGEVKERMAALKGKRAEAAALLSAETLRLYESVRLIRPQAVAKVDRGMCQGCRLILPVGEWQRVRSGALVRCSSCSRILCLE